MELASGLLDRGHSVTTISRRCSLPPHDHLRWVRIQGPARPFPLAYSWFFLAGSLAVFRYRRVGLLHTTGAVVFNRADISTVHHCHHGVHAKTSVISMSRSNLIFRVNARISEFMKIIAERICYQPGTTAHLVGDSKGLAKELVQHFPRMNGAISVIPLGVDVDEFHPNPRDRAKIRDELRLRDEDFVTVFVGGDWERKGLRYAVEAASATPGTHLLVVGSGDVPRYRRVADEFGGSERVRFIGQPGRVAPYYSASDAFLFPTAYETFSMVTHEAAAAGLPLLVTRVSGVEELITDGINGWFIERDSKSIGLRLAELRDKPELRREMGRQSREAASRRSWPAMVNSYVSLYSRLVETRVVTPASVKEPGE
jgi:glycosyltransferase involved in cell wall biosynthesis